MTVRESTIERIRRLPEPLVREVSQYLDALQARPAASPSAANASYDEVVARVRGVRGRFARPGSALASDELHAERQRDKQRSRGQRAA